MLYRQASQHGNDASAKFHLRFSTDGAVSWTEADTFTDGDPCSGAPFTCHTGSVDQTDGIILLAPNGDLLVQIHEGDGKGTYQYRSTDGGATWTDEGQIGGAAKLTLIGGQDYEIVGSTIYIPVMVDANSDEAHPYLLALYKSADNGVTWTLQGNIDAVNDSSEPGIVSTGGNGMLVLARHTLSAVTYKYTSTDLGATWSARATDYGLAVLQRPRLHTVSDGIIACGRNQISGNDLTIVYHSSDDGVTWDRIFFPDPDGATEDCGYCDFIEITDGLDTCYYMVSYAGDNDAASLQQYTFLIGQEKYPHLTAGEQSTYPAAS